MSKIAEGGNGMKKIIIAITCVAAGVAAFLNRDKIVEIIRKK